MARKTQIILFAASAAAILAASRANGSETPWTTVTRSGFSFPSISSPRGQLTPTAPDSYGTKLTTAQARELASRLDAGHFGGWFTQRNLINLIVAIWRVESGLKPGAINRKDPQGGAWGIGQVLAGVAIADYGLFSPTQLLDAETGARVSMAHIKSTYERLEVGLKRQPTRSEWIQAYNVGVAGYLAGRRSSVYLLKVRLYF